MSGRLEVLIELMSDNVSVIQQKTYPASRGLSCPTKTKRKQSFNLYGNTVFVVTLQFGQRDFQGDETFVLHTAKELPAGMHLYQQIQG